MKGSFCYLMVLLQNPAGPVLLPSTRSAFMPCQICKLLVCFEETHNMVQTADAIVFIKHLPCGLCLSTSSSLHQKQQQSNPPVVLAKTRGNIKEKHPESRERNGKCTQLACFVQGLVLPCCGSASCPSVRCLQCLAESSPRGSSRCVCCIRFGLSHSGCSHLIVEKSCETSPKSSAQKKK